MNFELDYKEIGRCIKRERLSMEIKQIEIAEAIDISPQYMSRIESGIGVSLPVVVGIANKLGIGCDRLLGKNLKITKSILSAQIANALDGCDPQMYESIYNYILFLQENAKQS